MRPEILNPLFAEAETLPGVGPQVAKQLKRLGITRVVDLLYHLPTGLIERVRAPAASGALLGHNVILQVNPFQIREPRSGRGPTRVFASDGDVHHFILGSGISPWAIYVLSALGDGARPDPGAGRSRAGAREGKAHAT